MLRKRLPIFQKVSNHLKISIFTAKMKIPIIPKLIFLKKPTKLTKKYKLLKHYKYGYIQEYQFSSSSTPLVYYHIKPFKKRNYRDKYANLFMCQCLDYPILEALPAIEDAIARELSEFSNFSGEEYSLDERAERFIERLYHEEKKM
ncbi:hypothetical protein CsSME_00037299 [Camellia sinensis var. sinensis]